MSIKNVSFVGLGVMGYPMAGHLQKNGYNVTVFNRTESKAKKWVEEYGSKHDETIRVDADEDEVVEEEEPPNELDELLKRAAEIAKRGAIVVQTPKNKAKKGDESANEQHVFVFLFVFVWIIYFIIRLGENL